MSEACEHAPSAVVLLVVYLANGLLVVATAAWYHAVRVNDGVLQAHVNGAGEGWAEFAVLVLLLLTAAYAAAIVTQQRIAWRRRP